MSLSLTTVLYHGHLTNSQRSRYQRWKRNICLSRMQQEKSLRDVNYFGVSTSSFRPPSSTRTIKEPLPSRKILRTINERNTSIFGITSYVRRSKTTRFGSNTSPQMNSLLMSSSSRLDPRSIIIRVNYYLFSINLRRDFESQRSIHYAIFMVIWIYWFCGLDWISKKEW
jgi:hypothetical protein